MNPLMQANRIAPIAVLGLLVACSGTGQPIPPGGLSQQPSISAGVDRATQDGSLARRYGWRPMFGLLPARNVDFADLQRQATTGRAIPFYQSSVKSPLDGKTYTYEIAGADPTKSNATTNVLYVPIVVRTTFSDGTVLDPSKPGCSDTVSVENRNFKGPSFRPTDLVSNGVDVGTTQLTDGFQRAEFWSVLAGPNYHTMLKPATPPIHVDISPPGTTVPGPCNGSGHRVGKVDFGTLDRIVQNLALKNAAPNEVPVFLFYNLLLTVKDSCCYFGYHNAFGLGPSGTQVYVVSPYLDAFVFQPPYQDIDTLTHELGETLNDPFINNATPAWGHVGQVQGCQSNLEVGDPLSGDSFDLTYNGFTYHPQGLAFFDWFFRTPSEGTGGYYSFKGAFKTPQGPCQ